MLPLEESSCLNEENTAKENAFFVGGKRGTVVEETHEGAEGLVKLQRGNQESTFSYGENSV